MQVSSTFNDATAWLHRVAQPGGVRFVLNPTRYVNPTAFNGFDLEEWSKSQYEWAPDARWTDSLQDPMETVEQNEGDCEDYAAVALATLMARDHDEIVVSFHVGVPTSHVTVWADGTLYSSGDIREISLDEYAGENDYFWAYHTTVTP